MAKGLRVSPDLTLPLDAVTQTIALLAIKRWGKALALDTLLPTPEGWTTMGEVGAGDVLYDEQGQPCVVMEAWPVRHGRPCFEVEFSDGSVITADAEHQWEVETEKSRRLRRAPEVRTTEEMHAAPRVAHRCNSGDGTVVNYSVRVAAPLRCSERALPVPPYTLGAWMGDGATATGSITSADLEIIAEIENEGETTWVIPSTVKSHHASYRIEGLTPRLKAAGVLGDKHIPLIYQRGSEGQRRALLAGLLDTDGSCHKGRVEITSVRERLARDVYQLVASLGYKPTLRHKPARLYGKDCGTRWVVRFRASDKVFRLARKTCQQALAGPMSSRRFIVAVRPVASVPVRCISVDSPSHLYLAGETCIPTHNSNAAAVMAEEMYDAGLPWIGIDPKGDWWGLRSSADGKGPGLPIPVFGGLHGDMPLEPEAGALIAELIVEHNLTCVLDVSRFSKAGRIKFLTAFAERLYELHQADPQPRHLFLEEAHVYLPQRVMAEMARCVGAWTQIITMGGSFGLGITLLSQRSATINKDALTQVEGMIAGRATSPQDRKVIHDWMEHHAVAGEIVDSLPGLLAGEAWVSSSFWLPDHGQPALQRARFRQRRTFDSGATPAVGKQRRPATVADVDLGALQARMAAVVEKAAQEDPKALRRKIADLRRQLAAKDRDAPAAGRIADLERQLAEALSHPAEQVEVPVLQPGEQAAVEQVVTGLRDLAGDLSTVASRLEAALGRASTAAKLPPPPAPVARVPVRAQPPAERSTVSADEDAGELKLGRAHRAFLTVLAQFPEGRTRNQLAMLSGYSVKSSMMDKALSQLRSAGLVEPGQPLRATMAGIDALNGEYDPLPTGPALVQAWMDRLGKAERAFLQVLLDAWPGALTKAQIAEMTGYSGKSSMLDKALSRLRTLELATGHGDIYADETLAQHAQGAPV